jgi:polysaccharide export outer membrane protein
MSCASGPKQVNSNAESPVPEPPEAVAGEPQFTLGPGDNITISVWRNEDLHRTVSLDPSGKIRMPLAGEIDASGMTVSQLNEEITRRLAEYIKNPSVDVNVVTMKSRKIHVMGQVRNPGTFANDRPVPAWEAVLQAGGFTSDANERKLLLVKFKDGEASVSVLELDFEKMYENGMIKADYYLKDGDLLYVPEALISSIEKFMTRLNNIIAPIYNLERMIYLGPDVIDILSGKDINRSPIIAQ